MKQPLTIILFLIGRLCFANMASPIHEGTWTARPFISQYVDILKENILIVPDDKFETAQFKIEYHIKADRSGVQIPLLFYASEFKENFKIWIDDREIKLKQVPETYKKLEGTPFNDFAYFFDTKNRSETKRVLIEDSPSGGFYVSIDDLKFFETDLTEGNHIIRVEYVANKWIDRSDWVKEYSFRYALSPAKYWKSFGRLEITIDASRFDGNITTNIGAPTTGDLHSNGIWTFTSIPTEVLQISYTPCITPTAHTLLKISPTGLTLLLSIILILLHFISIRIYRKANPNKRFSWTMIVGSVIVPFLALFGYMYTFDIIDTAIGQEASRYHGYTFLIILLYPILLPMYWTIMWLVDKTIKGRINNAL